MRKIMPREKFEPEKMDNLIEISEEEARVKYGGPLQSRRKTGKLAPELGREFVGAEHIANQKKEDSTDVGFDAESHAAIGEDEIIGALDQKIKQEADFAKKEKEFDPYQVPIKEGRIVSMKSRMGEIAEDLGKGKKVDFKNFGEAMEYHNLSEVAREQQSVRDEQKKLREQNRGKRKSQPFSRQQEKRA
jgi:hypothetical protein